MSKDWWANKLNGNPVSPPRTSLPPVSPPVRIGTHVQIPRQDNHEPRQPHNANVIDPDKPPTAEVHMGDAIRLWKGGEAARKEGGMTCPECGSPHVFSRVTRGSNTTIQGKAPAPRCFECGWTGMYVQGDETNWVAR